MEHERAKQCGFCTPGFIVASTAFVRQHPNASVEQVRAGLGGNLCRCGTYAGCCSPSPMQRKERRNMAKVDLASRGQADAHRNASSRIDSPPKTTGTAKYSYDINRPGMLWAKPVTSPYAKSRKSLYRHQRRRSAGWCEGRLENDEPK